jgi:hypothetical protein
VEERVWIVLVHILLDWAVLYLTIGRKEHKHAGCIVEFIWCHLI